MNVLIVEDEAAAARRLEKMILETSPAARIVDTLDSVEGTVGWLQQNPAPDLLFLDIQLADGSSFEIFEHIAPPCPIIFTTAFDEYAIQAFKVNAIDYLLKPIKQTELKQALDRYARLQQPEKIAAMLHLLQSSRPENYLRRMLIRLGNSIKLVDVNDATYFYTQNKINFLVLLDSGKRLPVDYPLDKLETLLDPEKFFRINRQMIIQLKAIKEMYPFSKSRIKLDLEPPIDLDTIVSTERSAHFKKWLIGEKID
ncbi:MAG: response regulator transcription factor [Lewinellaceae bacterium]|nr:response regulator transcription factor [Lewinellaceae bacterium]